MKNLRILVVTTKNLSARRLNAKLAKLRGNIEIQEGLCLGI
jgi:hypothetical protein